jgi:hypothetical protein
MKGLTNLWRPKIIVSESMEYHFYTCCNDGKIIYTLMDRSGNRVKREELPLTLECFLKAMKKVGFKAIWN